MSPPPHSLFSRCKFCDKPMLPRIEIWELTVIGKPPFCMLEGEQIVELSGHLPLTWRRRLGGIYKIFNPNRIQVAWGCCSKVVYGKHEERAL